MKKTQSVAGMSLGGGKRENFFFCLLEYFEEEKRWFLTSLKQVKDEENLDRDKVITSWIENYSLQRLVVDFPLTKPICEHCTLKCPGITDCHHPVVKNIREQMDELLDEDKELRDSNPKRYEQRREASNQTLKYKAVKKDTTSHLLTKSFKRKLKKGFLPYWNRPVDFWIWKNYYDEILNYFNSSYDSFGNVSLMLMQKLKFLLKHFPSNLSLYESHTYFVLIELLKAKILAKRDLDNLFDLEEAAITRIKIAKKIEKKMKIFIYNKDLELIAKNPKAFDSFLLAISGQCLLMDSYRDIENFGERDSSNLIVPSFFEAE